MGAVVNLVAPHTVHRLPVVTVAAEADPGEHGWHVRARRNRRLVYYRHAFGLLSTATDNAADLAAARRWWVDL